MPVHSLKVCHVLVWSLMLLIISDQGLISLSSSVKAFYGWNIRQVWSTFENLTRQSCTYSLLHLPIQSPCIVSCPSCSVQGRLKRLCRSRWEHSVKASLQIHHGQLQTMGFKLNLWLSNLRENSLTCLHSEGVPVSSGNVVFSWWRMEQCLAFWERESC